MPEDQNSAYSQFLFSKLMEISTSVATMSQRLEGFLSTQQSMRGEIDAIKSDVSAVRADVTQIKHRSALKAARLAGAITVITAISSTATIFIVPYLKKLLGI